MPPTQGYAVVSVGNTAAAETQPSMFYGPPSIELWENHTYCFQFKMQMQVSEELGFKQPCQSSLTSLTVSLFTDI